MGRILYFDCFSGISGDMTLGALVHLGVDPAELEKELQGLGIGGYDLTFCTEQKYGITGVNCHVVMGAEADRHDRGHEQDHTHAHEHENEHDHHHHHDHEHEHTHEHRSYDDIKKIISESRINPHVKKIAASIFHAIAKAEATVHNKSLGEVHFHEVGALDSLVDIVGTAIGIHMLGVDRVICSVVREGSGFVSCEHGMLPVPVPAVLEMLKDSGIRIIQTNIKTELITPTGLGILKGVEAVSLPIPPMKVSGVGYGFGKKDTGELNALRLILGEESADGKREESAEVGREDKEAGERVEVLETNLDDETGETLGYTMERLLSSGALDVFFTPIYMKKNRPGVMLSVLCRPEKTVELAGILLSETSSLGVRYQEANRIVLDRQTAIVETPFGTARVKIIGQGNTKRIEPEYEDCAKMARERGIHLKEAYEIIKSGIILDK